MGSIRLKPDPHTRLELKSDSTTARFTSNAIDQAARPIKSTTHQEARPIKQHDPSGSTIRDHKQKMDRVFVAISSS
jgi:hypothetical protein